VQEKNEEMIHTSRNIRADDNDDGEGDISLQLVKRCVITKRLVF
jgi:hypothetical protein